MQALVLVRRLMIDLSKSKRKCSVNVDFYYL